MHLRQRCVRFGSRREWSVRVVQPGVVRRQLRPGVRLQSERSVRRGHQWHWGVFLRFRLDRDDLQRVRGGILRSKLFAVFALCARGLL